MAEQYEAAIMSRLRTQGPEPDHWLSSLPLDRLLISVTLLQYLKNGENDTDVFYLADHCHFIFRWELPCFLIRHADSSHVGFGVPKSCKRGHHQCTNIPVSAHLICDTVPLTKGHPRWLSGKESTCQCRRHRSHGFDTWVRKTRWRKEW